MSAAAETDAVRDLRRESGLRVAEHALRLFQARMRDGADPIGAIDETIDSLRELRTEAVGADQPAVSFATLAELLAQPELLEPPHATIPRLAYRGRLVILAGPDKSGKSTLLAHAIAALSRACPFLDARVDARHGRALLVGLEEALGDEVRRLHELEANGERVRLLRLRPPDLLAAMRSVLAEWPVDVLVIDSLQEYARTVAGSVPDDGDNAGWATVIRPLVEVAREYDVAVVVLHHVRRSDGQYRGAGEIAAAADALLEMARGAAGDDPRIRRITGRGRWPIEPFAVALRDGRYELAGGAELSLDARVFLHIEREPGISKNRLRAAMEARSSAVDAAVSQLMERGAIVDRGTGRGSALFSAGDVSGEIEF